MTIFQMDQRRWMISEYDEHRCNLIAAWSVFDGARIAKVSVQEFHSWLPHMRSRRIAQELGLLQEVNVFKVEGGELKPEDPTPELPLL